MKYILQCISVMSVSFSMLKIFNVIEINCRLFSPLDHNVTDFFVQPWEWIIIASYSLLNRKDVTFDFSEPYKFNCISNSKSSLKCTEKDYKLFPAKQHRTFERPCIRTVVYNYSILIWKHTFVHLNSAY